MLTYTFSTREKVLLAVLAFVAIVVLWYQLIFANIQNQINEADSQIASLQDELVVVQAKASSLATMREVVEQYEAQGIEPVVLPAYDNTQNLMAYLNGVLTATRGYSISFDNPELSEEDGSIHRTGTVVFGSGSYAEARSVVQNIARGPYPCQIDSLSIADNTQAGTRDSGSSAPYTANVQVTFYEKAPEGAGAAEDDGGDTGVQGNDLSALNNWKEMTA